MLRVTWLLGLVASAVAMLLTPRARDAQSPAHARILELATSGAVAEAWTAWTTLPAGTAKLALGVDLAVAVKQVWRGVSLYEDSRCRNRGPAASIPARADVGRRRGPGTLDRPRGGDACLWRGAPARADTCRLPRCPRGPGPGALEPHGAGARCLHLGQRRPGTIPGPARSARTQTGPRSSAAVGTDADSRATSGWRRAPSA